RALRRGAAARLDRARVREPPAAPRLRRADGQPRPRHLGRDHAAPLPDQHERHDRADGHARPRDGRQDAQARDPARGRAARARRAPRRLRGRMRVRMLVSEAWRSLAANVSTTFAATMTVLVGMFVLGLFIALFTWTQSWSNHVKRQLIVKVDFKTGEHQATRRQENAVARMLQSNPKIKLASFVPKEEAFRRMQKRYPDLTRNVPWNPLPDSFEITPVKAEYIHDIAESLRPPPPGVDKVIEGKRLSSRVITFAHVIDVVFAIGAVVLVLASTLLIANTIRLS